MPFKSKSQMRKFAILEKAGKLPEGTTEKWASETDDSSLLPERVKVPKARPSHAIKRPIRSVADLRKAAKAKK